MLAIMKEKYKFKAEIYTHRVALRPKITSLPKKPKQCNISKGFTEVKTHY